MVMMMHLNQVGVNGLHSRTAVSSVAFCVCYALNSHSVANCCAHFLETYDDGLYTQANTHQEHHQHAALVKRC